LVEFLSNLKRRDMYGMPEMALFLSFPIFFFVNNFVISIIFCSFVSEFN